MNTPYLYGRNDVLREVETLEAAEAGEGVPAHRLDGVGLQGQRCQVLQALRDYKFSQKHSRGLNRVLARTYMFACLYHLSTELQMS